MKKDHIQQATAVILVLSSIILAFIQACTYQDIANGVLMYIAQAFLLAGSLFGLEHYYNKMNHHDKDYTTRNKE